MAVVFRFNSLDSRRRATLALPNVDAAIAHIEATFDLSEFAMDEDGETAASLSEISKLIARGESVVLHDLEGWQSRDSVEILHAPA